MLCLRSPFLFYLPQVCFNRCAADDALYFALNHRSKCQCGYLPTYLQVPRQPSECEDECSGDSSIM